MVPPSLPSRFPCWCRATYSWGGESKRDLGFIEGDLIECLNAGDGSWWMGRLRRNKTTGLFPSNFVTVLDSSFQPSSRGSSPMPSQRETPSPRQSKSKHFRKPFQAYAQADLPNHHISKTNATLKYEPSTFAAPTSSPSRRYTITRPRKHSQDQAGEKAVPYVEARWQNSTSASSGWGVSHSSGLIDHGNSDGYSDREPLDKQSSSSSPPPPAPPPHRTVVEPKSVCTSDIRRSRASMSSPRPSSSLSRIGNTPSPLRDAMDDIMSSLQDMQLRGDTQHSFAAEDHIRQTISSQLAESNAPSGSSGGILRRPKSAIGLGFNQRPAVSTSEFDIHSRGKRKTRGNQFGTDEHSVDLSSEFEGELIQDTNCWQVVDRTSQPMHYTDVNNPKPQYLETVTLEETTPRPRLRARKSAYELGRHVLGRTLSVKSSTTVSSSGQQSVSTNKTYSTDRTNQSLMSGHSAGGFSATSAGSFARRKTGEGGVERPQSTLGFSQSARLQELESNYGTRSQLLSTSSTELSTPHGSNSASETGSHALKSASKSRRGGFFRKLVDSAKVGAASSRGTIADGKMEPPKSPIRSLLPIGSASTLGTSPSKSHSNCFERGPSDWVQVRRDVNRANSLSRNELTERFERCQMMGIPARAPVQELFGTVRGDETFEGEAAVDAVDYQLVNLQLVDKAARFVSNPPPMSTAASVAQNYLCRPYRSDVQRLRAIFIWVSEKIAWEEDYEGDVDTRRVIQLRRGCSKEVAILVQEMCTSIGIAAELVEGFLKRPGEVAESVYPNHWWNTVVVDGHWRIMDCSLAAPTNPIRSLYSSVGAQTAETGFFLMRPMESCYTHVPMWSQQQHICPSVPTEVLLALPCACPPYFKYNLQLIDFDTSQFRIENLELVHIHCLMPNDVECIAEVETRSYEQDEDGDVFENGESKSTRALAQAQWIDGRKRYTIKANLPCDASHGILKVFAGKRGLMHSARDNPHPLAFVLPIIHKGENPAFEFFLRHPTPHAQRQDLYVSQPQCRRLAINNTFVFAIRQHPAALGSSCLGDGYPPSPSPLVRPSSSLSMVSSTASETVSQTSSAAAVAREDKPAKLAIQSPSGKIIRLVRKNEISMAFGETASGGTWETVIKVGEEGVWRGLVLADRSARWCVFGEWFCV